MKSGNARDNFRNCLPHYNYIKIIQFSFIIIYQYSNKNGMKTHKRPIFLIQSERVVSRYDECGVEISPRSNQIQIKINCGVTHVSSQRGRRTLHWLCDLWVVNDIALELCTYIYQERERDYCEENLLLTKMH